MKSRPKSFSIFRFILLVTSGLIASSVVTAEEEKAKEKTITRSFVSADNNAPLADAIVFVAGSQPPSVFGILSKSRAAPIELPSLPTTNDANSRERQKRGHFHRIVTDETGSVDLPASALETGATIFNDHGIAWLDSTRLKPATPAIRVTLQPWGRAEGRVTSNGEPAAGITLTAARTNQGISVGNMAASRSATVQHTITATTDRSGRFVFEPLVPTSLDEAEGLSYQLTQEFTMSNGTYLMSLGQGSFLVAAGETTTALDFGSPVTGNFIVRGRLIYADGKPYLPQAHHPADEKTEKSPENFVFQPLWQRYSSRMISGSFMPKIDADGSFETTLPISGDWALSLGLGMMPLAFAGNEDHYHFQIPDEADDGESRIVDLGDITLHFPRETIAANLVKPTQESVPPNGEIEILTWGLPGELLPGVTITPINLVSRVNNGSHYHSDHVRALQASTTDQEGRSLLVVPTEVRSDDDNKVSKIAAVELELSHPNFTTMKMWVQLYQPTAQVAMKPSSVLALNATLDDQPLRLDQLAIRNSQPIPQRYFPFNQWQQVSNAIEHGGVPTGNWKFQAAHLATDGWRCFSPAVSVANPDNAAKRIDVPIRLERGLRLAGKLDMSVPRPILDGVVRAVVFSSDGEEPTNISRSGTEGDVVWSDWQTVGEDGSFEFNGLPEGKIWWVAKCDGWFSQQTEQPAMTEGFAELSGSTTQSMRWRARPVENPVEKAEGHIIPMIRTGNCIATFRHQNGTPVADAGTWWTAVMITGDRIVENLDSCEQGLDHKLGLPGGTTPQAAQFLARIPRQTDSKGKLTITGLPPAEARFAIRAPHQSGFFQNADPVAKAHEMDITPFRVNIRSGETTEVEFIVIDEPSAEQASTAAEIP